MGEAMSAFKRVKRAAANAARGGGLGRREAAGPATAFALSVAMSVVLSGVMAGWPGVAQAAEVAEVSVVIRNHRFEPAEIKVPAGRKVKLVLSNQDGTPEEFESHELKREKVIPAGARATVFIGPLEKGRYPFFGEFNQATAQGVVVVE